MNASSSVGWMVGVCEMPWNVPPPEAKSWIRAIRYLTSSWVRANMLRYCKPTVSSSSPPESTGDGILLLPYIVIYLCTTRARDGWGRGTNIPGEAIRCAIFERHGFSTGIGVGGPPLPLLVPLFSIGYKGIPFLPHPG